jgi:DNA-directed RNA polymerase specialized sigma24 family protein
MTTDDDGRTDAQLLRDAAREPAAFAELYRRHALTVHMWFRRRLDWAASDLTAETFAQAWMSRRRFRDERGGSALPWLLGIAQNVFRESARRDRIETRARERLGLPVVLAADDGFGAVDDRPSPRRALADVRGAARRRKRGPCQPRRAASGREGRREPRTTTRPRRAGCTRTVRTIAAHCEA